MGEKKYFCDICKLGFTSKYRMKKHILSHFDDFKCKVCGKIFSTHKKLKNHTKVAHESGKDNEIYLKEVQATEVELSEEQVKNAIDTHFDKSCDMCSIELSSFQEAKTHYLTIHKYPKGYMKYCDLKHRTQKEVLDHIGLKHIAGHTNSLDLRCRICDYVSTTRAYLVRHIKKHQFKLTTEFHCPTCDTLFGDAKIYNAHMKQIHPELKQSTSTVLQTEPEVDPIDIEIPHYFDNSCDLCPVEFKTFREARSHYLNAHANPNAYVKCCEERFYLKHTYRDHIEWHKNPAAFTNFKLNRHKKMHTNELTCNKCNKTFSMSHNLRAHMITHEKRDRKFKCNICNKCFYTEKSLMGHHLLHRHPETKTKPATHVCEFCGKGYSNRKVLERHVEKIHKGGTIKREFQCNICQIWLANKFYLKQHIMTHNSEPQKCDQCDKVSPNALALKQHFAAVHCEAKHKCHLCDKTFRLPASLKDHIATHKGEKNYKCTFCDEAFIWRTNMYKHRKNVHKTEWLAEKARIEAERKTPN